MAEMTMVWFQGHLKLPKKKNKEFIKIFRSLQHVFTPTYAIQVINWETNRFQTKFQMGHLNGKVATDQRRVPITRSVEQK